MNDRDATIGRNLAALRGGMPQKTLADLMRDAGWKWSQATVWSIEQGERPLKLAEAEYLTTNIFHAEPFLLLGQEWESLVRSSLNELIRSRMELSDAVRRHVAAQRKLADRLDLSSSDLSIAARGEVSDFNVSTAAKYLAESPQEAVRGMVRQILAKDDLQQKPDEGLGAAAADLIRTLSNG